MAGGAACRRPAALHGRRCRDRRRDERVRDGGRQSRRPRGDPLVDPDERRGLLPGGRARRARRAAWHAASCSRAAPISGAWSLSSGRAPVEAGDVIAFAGGVVRGRSTEIDAPRDDRERICLGIAERAGLCARSSRRPGGRRGSRWPASAGTPRGRVDLPRGGRPRLACLPRGRGVQFGIRRMPAADVAGPLRRRPPGAPLGRCCDVCDPDTIGLPDPASLTPARVKRTRAADAPPIDPADAGLLGGADASGARARATANPPTPSPITARWRRSRR